MTYYLNQTQSIFKHLCTGTDPLTAEQEPQRLELADIHGGGLQAEAEVSGELPAQALLCLLITVETNARLV